METTLTRLATRMRSILKGDDEDDGDAECSARLEPIAEQQQLSAQLQAQLLEARQRRKERVRLRSERRRMRRKEKLRRSRSVDPEHEPGFISILELQ